MEGRSLGGKGREPTRVKIPDPDSAQQQLERSVQRISRNFPDRIRIDYQLLGTSKRYARLQRRNYPMPLIHCRKKPISCREIDDSSLRRSL